MTDSPQAANERYAQAVQYLRAGDVERASDVFAAVLRDAPTAEAWSDWAKTRRLLGDMKGAETGWLHALELEARNGAVLADLGRLWASQERWSIAAPVLEHAVALHGGIAAPEPLRAAATAAREREPAPNPLAAGLRILWIHDQLPEADRSGAEQRVAVLLAELRRQGHAVTYFARAGAGQERYLQPLAQLCDRIFYCDAPRTRWLSDAPGAARIERLLSGSRFDLAVVSHWHWNVWACSEQYVQLIRGLAPGARIIVLSEDHHGLREERLAALTGEWTDRERAYNYSVRELDAYRRADMVWAVSTADRDSLLARDPDLAIEVLPPIVELAPPGPGWEARGGIVFLGEYLNAANRQGIEWFLDAIWPRVRAQLPEAKLHLVGSHLPPEYSRHPGVVPDGFAPELAPVFARHRLAVCPIAFGTGIKTKNLAALRYGLPFVTTTCGAEGMDLRDGETALIADEPAAFAARIVSLYRDEALWRRLSAAGREHAATAFSPARLAQRLRETLDQVLAQPVQPGRPLTAVSPLWVEEAYPDVLTHQPGSERVQFRARRYLDLAQRELAAGHFDAARHQCGHALNLARHPANPLLPRIQALLDRIARREREAPVAPAAPADAAMRHRSRRGALRAPAISVIIPTHNRRATLERCLQALGAQTLPPDAFEVIVVDDGSSDDTAGFCRAFHAPFPFRFGTQPNAGAGAARRHGVSLARGERLLLINDDTIAAPDLLATHLEAGPRGDARRLAVLGDFRYPDAARGRALTCALAAQPILFLQPALAPGAELNYVGFMTCNISLPRTAVLAAGNFDAAFAVAEDTELGARLQERGWGVIYEAAAGAIHDHGPFTSADFVARARRYGPANLRLYRKHPRLLAGGPTLLGRLDDAARQAMRSWMEQHGPRIAESLRAIAAFDEIDFRPFFSRWMGNQTAAEVVVAQFAQALLPIHWFYVYESLLAAWDQEPPAAAARPRPAMAAVGGVQ